MPRYQFVGELSFSAEIDADDEAHARTVLAARLMEATAHAQTDYMYIGDGPEWEECESIEEWEDE